MILRRQVLSMINYNDYPVYHIEDIPVLPQNRLFQLVPPLFLFCCRPSKFLFFSPPPYVCPMTMQNPNKNKYRQVLFLSVYYSQQYYFHYK